MGFVAITDNFLKIKSVYTTVVVTNRKQSE